MSICPMSIANSTVYRTFQYFAESLISNQMLFNSFPNPVDTIYIWRIKDMLMIYFSSKVMQLLSNMSWIAENNYTIFTPQINVSPK